MQARVARLNLRGVSAMNRNDRKVARESFEQAYKMDPKNSFALNNMGYLAELQGDTETAQSFYEQAQRAERARQKVMVSTRPEVEGQTVGHVAEQSTTLVESSFEARAEARRRSGAPPALRTRDNRIIVEPKTNSRPAPTLRLRNFAIRHREKKSRQFQRRSLISRSRISLRQITMSRS